MSTASYKNASPLVMKISHENDDEENQALLGSQKTTPNFPKRKITDQDLEEASIEDLNPGLEREVWGSKVEFLLTLVGYAVGLGNVWRFPYLVYDNGGGAFLLPYWLCLFVLGVPMMAMEMGAGQRFQLGAIGVWKNLHPRLTGLGICSTILSWLVCLYYNIIITWTIYYFFVSFQDPLPWEDANDPEAAQHYFWDKIQKTDSINDLGTISWELSVCLTGSWIFMYFCVFQGIQSTGKVVYFTALFPYVVLIILFFRGVTLDGAADGIEFYLTPDWNKLSEYRTWVAAAGQIFYSLGISFGSIVAFSSFSPRDSNFMRDAWVVALINCATSFFAGFVVFSCLGFMAHERGVDVADVVDSGTGLAFTAYPEALGKMPASPFFSTIFFLMLFCLGADSEFGMVEAVVTPIMDSKMLPGWVKKWQLVLFICVTGWAIGFLFITGGGVYIVNLFDTFSGVLSLFIVGFLQCYAISYIYGIQNFIDDIHLMTGWKLGKYWVFIWKYACPFLLVLLTITSVVSFTSDYKDLFCKTEDDEAGNSVYIDCGDVEWAVGLGIAVASCSMVVIPIFALFNWNKPVQYMSKLTPEEFARSLRK